MALALFAGICVSDYEAARPWYERPFGSEPTFVAHATEAVWDLDEHRSVTYRDADENEIGFGGAPV